MALKRVRVIISGRVQGVMYRATCSHVARNIGIKGWVRNRDDGTVEATFEGSEEQIKDMIKWCRKGPPYAVVNDVKVIEEEFNGERDFQIIG